MGGRLRRRRGAAELSANNNEPGESSPILHFDTSGRRLDAFGAGIFSFPHGLHVNHDRNVWVTDHGINPPNGKGHAVYKMSPAGKLRMTLGKPGVWHELRDHFRSRSRAKPRRWGVDTECGRECE